MTSPAGARARGLPWRCVLCLAWLELLAAHSVAAQLAPPSLPNAAPQGSQQVAAGGGPDTAFTPDELRQLGRQLGAPSAAQRERALRTLATLGEDALPAISARLQRLASTGLDAAAALTGMAELRRRAGSDVPDAEVDLFQGILPALAEERGAGTVLAAELIALLRALEAQKSPQAAELIVGKLFALDSKLFRFEAPRTRERLGVLIIPALIRHRAHPRSWVRKLCQETLLSMHVAEPGRAVQQDDVALLSAILLAYGDTLTFDAMPVVVSYVGDERSEVRAAARRALDRFGKNAIWQLRERYLNATGKEADASWGHQRILAELARWFDAPKRELVEQQLKQADAALARGDFGAAEAALDKALHAAPFGEDAQKAAPLYVRIAGHYEANENLDKALSCLRRALRLDPQEPNQRSSLARVKYLEAELRLSQGQVDLKSYEAALALDPGLSEARAVLDELTGINRERERTRQKALAFAAAFVLAAAGYLALRSRRAAALPAGPHEEDVNSAPST